MRVRLAAGIVLLLAVAPAIAGEEAGFKRIFNGRELKGWKAPDMSYWSVEDEAITGRSTASHPCTANQCLVWQNGELDDFELKLSFRLTGSSEACGGLQFRSRALPDGNVAGYLVDFQRGTDWRVRLYDEHRQNTLALRGRATAWNKQGLSREESLPVGADQPAADFKLDDWNAYHLFSQGGHLRLYVNDKLTAETRDSDLSQRNLSGLLALQLHRGSPTVAQFKNIRLKRLKLTDGRKKIVMISGKPSHGPGEHEYNAGCALLKRCLDASGLPVLTALYRGGWPADPTAFDNADAILLYMNGGPKHPIMGRQRLAEIGALMKEGVGLVCAHFAVEVPAEKGGPAFEDWIGGYYENGYSTNPHWTAKAELDPAHPITRGVKPFELHDEWYFNMRFRPNHEGVVSILRATPSARTRLGETSFPKGPYPHIVADTGQSETLMWAIERKDGGRGVGFTGGHFHRNWGNDDVRKLMLNALLWSAKLEVPDGGVNSTVSEEELKQNLDTK
jgi:type 1 glutamine amidotransferase